MNHISIRSFSRNTACFAVFLLAHAVRIPFDPDAHHDGLMYTAAVASAGGLFPHRDFFSQYGPLTPFIHGLWFFIAPNTLLSLRFFNAILLSIISHLTFLVLKKNLGDKIAFLVALVWSISSPEILPAGLPWPSVVSTLILLIAIYVADRSEIELNRITYVILGGISAISLFARIHNILILIMLITLCLFAKKYRIICDFLIGYLLSISTLLVFLHLHSGLFPLFQQSILWPFFGHAGSTYGIKALLVNALLLLQFPFFAFSLWLACKFTTRYRALTSTLITFCLISAYFYSRKIPHIPVSERSFTEFNFLSAFLAQQTMQIMTFGLIAVSLVLQFISMKKGQFPSNGRILVSSISIGALFQLYPSPDAYHVWWVAPLLFAGLPKNSKSILLKFIQPGVLIAILIVNLFLTLKIISLDRHSYKSTVLSGMYGNNATLDEALIALQNILPIRSAHFDCGDGIFAGNTKGYLANNVLYVNWPERVDNPQSNPATFLVQCSKPSESSITSDSVIWSNDIITIGKVR